MATSSVEDLIETAFKNIGIAIGKVIVRYELGNEAAWTLINALIQSEDRLRESLKKITQERK